MKKTVMLKKNYEFKNVLKRGKCYRGECINVFIKKNNKNINMLGLAVNKKAGKSVVRNKIKRLIREIYRQKEDVIKSGFDIIILWNNKNIIEKGSFYIIKKDFENILDKSQIME